MERLHSILKCKTLASCAFNIAQYGCRYPKPVENKLQFLHQYPDPVCKKIVKTINSEHKWIRDSRLRDRSKDSFLTNARKRRRQSSTNQVGRVEFKRRRTPSRPSEISRKPQRKAYGTQKLSIPVWPNVVSR